MTTSKGKKKQTGYTLAEIKDKYFPNRELSSLTNRDDSQMSRETFLNILKKVARPVQDQPCEEK